MFLNQLNEEQKIAFVELAHQVVNSDGEVSSEEKYLLATYLFEMQINDTTYKPKELDLESILQNFLDPKSRRIAYIEILALAHADQDYSKEEKTIIEKMEADFKITDEEKKGINNWLKRINQIYAEGYELINV